METDASIGMNEMLFGNEMLFVLFASDIFL